MANSWPSDLKSVSGEGITVDPNLQVSSGVPGGLLSILAQGKKSQADVSGNFSGQSMANAMNSQDKAYQDNASGGLMSLIGQMGPLVKSAMSQPANQGGSSPVEPKSPAFAFGEAAPTMADLGPGTSPLIAALSILGRLAGNIGGVATGRGAVGEEISKGEADQSLNQLAREQQGKTAAMQQFQDAMQAYKDKAQQAKTVFNLAKQESDPGLRGMAQALAQSGDAKSAIGLLAASQKDTLNYNRQMALFQDKHDITNAQKDSIEQLWKSGVDLTDPAQVKAAFETIMPNDSKKAAQAAKDFVKSNVEQNWFSHNNLSKASQQVFEQKYGIQPHSNMTPQDLQAIAWAKQNPTSDQAKAITDGLNKKYWNR